jgi:hypothetical protein
MSPINLQHSSNLLASPSPCLSVLALEGAWPLLHLRSLLLLLVEPHSLLLSAQVFASKCLSSWLVQGPRAEASFLHRTSLPSRSSKYN